MALRFIVDPRDSRPLYVQIMDEVRRLIILGEVGADDPLPSVRQLAADLRINHNTIVQAYRELERDGVVYVRRGQGTFVTPGVSLDDERAHILSDVIERALADARRNGLSPDDLLQGLAAHIEHQGLSIHKENLSA